jgi:hypothetical protein
MPATPVLRRIAIIAGAILLGLLAPKGSQAGICAGYPELPTRGQLKADVASELKRSIAVFTGTVTALDQFTVRMRVDRVWKGRVGRTVDFSTGTRKTADGMLSSNSEDYSFTLGVKYIVFAMGKSVRDMQAYQCGNTGPLKDAADTLTFLDELAPRQ